MSTFGEFFSLTADATKRGATESAELKSVRDDKFGGLYREYIGELVAGIRRQYGSGPPDPEDVAQEAFRRAYERADLMQITNLRGFLWRIARNLVIDAKKSKESRSKYDFEVAQIFFPLRGDISSPETVIQAREQLRQINALLRSMPKKRRWALLARRLEGLTHEEIGQRLGISRSAVAKHISRAEMQISELLLEDDK